MTAQDWNQTETLYAFMGWLTARFPPILIGSTELTPPVLDLIQQFVERHDLPLACRDGWDAGIVPESEIL